jgi:DNA (cytosine-5)-methyltransferase 1
MTRKRMLVADLLCGAGGSSTGCQRALAEMGLEMELVCLNHWPTAIETHRRNHPEARHYCQDISTVRPHLIVPEGYLDLLMASPSCTHHSVARGGKPTSDQQRSDPWHIITWLTELRVKRIIIENVWEF